MEFVAPLMLVGALGVAVPIAIHLIGRRRAKVVRFAAIDFLLGSNRKTARRLQLRELLLLLTRVLVCLAIPLALSKPYAGCTATGPAVERGPQAAVLVIDNSVAARYLLDGTPLLARAKQRAAAILAQLGPEADVAIVMAAEGAAGPDELSRDHVRLRDRIDAIEASARRADVATALRRAGQLLAASSHERRTVFLVSSMPATAFDGDPPWPAGEGPSVIVVDPAEGAPLDNAAVVDLAVEPDPSTGSRGVRITAELANYGVRAIEERGVAVRIDDRVVARGLVTLLPGEQQTRVFLAALPADASVADVAIELDGDALALDDRRYARAALREEIRVLLVNGDPRTIRHDDELFYLEAALRPGDRADTGAVLTIVTVDELPGVRLADFDVAVLANVRALPRERVAPLAAWVAEGGGLLVAPGDNVDADAYNRTMQPLLPQLLRTPIDTTYGSSGAERDGRALRLTGLETDHPVFSIFSRDAPGLREAAFSKVMLLGPTTRVDERRVLARYTNGAAALIEARVGTGRLMLFTSSLDRDWNDLVIQPGFLPLVQQLVRHLARKDAKRSREALLVGRAATLPVDPDVERIEVRSPIGDRAAFDEQALADRKQLRYDRTDVPGIYRVLLADRGADSRRAPQLDFAVNLDPRGSDLRPIDPSELPAAAGTPATASAATHIRRVELWHAIAAGLLLLLLVESVLVLRATG